ncbi:DUF1853 family protein [Flagellimonas meridianipacifica]|uniref:DUF1853 family protein n=1 Tax=Flagellimonas meridianipacifica TaxID=1080225 RepID=A0A2T0MC06_9FLAO|nr:DUF1853 family protein [Allomuricauda pacifica]PRX55037.1 hypothetical protein CLV81_3443 [Allomuricauda pacifica]
MYIKQVEGFYNTPPLWRAIQFGIQQFEFPEMDLKGLHPVDIPENLRLGHQMEYVFEQLIRFDGTYGIMLMNQAVRSGKKTIGEIDFILNQSVSNIVHHVELTYKFYVIDSSISEPIHRLMGPNRRDMFFTKMEKIKNEQFALINRPETQSILDEIGLNSNVLHQSCCFKAQLFRPFDEPIVHIRPLNPSCVVGYWMRFENFEKVDYGKNLFYIPFKKEWPIQPHENVTWMSYTETLMEVNLRMIQKNTPMLWMKKTSGTLEKLFVVWW